MAKSPLDPSVATRSNVLIAQELEQLSREQLVEHIKRQNEYIKKQSEQIRELQDRREKRNQNGSLPVAQTKTKKAREFNFQKYEKKHVALKFFYLGWNYDGFVEQTNTKNTVEDHLFAALVKTRLIESRQTSNYNRCGRTDKGVSAFSQVVSLDLRSKLSSSGAEEIKWCKILNKILPKDIRCVCAAEVEPEFSARFSCKKRTYRYFFPVGLLDLELMRKAGSYLEGTHDFRNFCKLDKTKLITNYIRTIDSVRIVKFQSAGRLRKAGPDDLNPPDRNADRSDESMTDGATDERTTEKSTEGSPRDIYELQIRSSAFLWHQIRCIVSVLFCIGSGAESPELVLELFDPNKFSCKPLYSLAYELPLVLFDCEFDVPNWTYDEEAMSDAIASLNEFWIENTIKCAVTTCMLKDLEERRLAGSELNELHKFFVGDLAVRNYRKFSERAQCDMELSEVKRDKLSAKLKTKFVNQAVVRNDCKRIKLDHNLTQES